MRFIKIIILFCFFSVGIKAQPYVYIHTNTTGLIQSNSAWVDVNKDGYNDLVTTGERYSANQKIVETSLYINDKKGSFIPQSSGIMNMYRSAMDWEDLDKDGDQDLFITGENSKGEIVSRIYQNNGWGRFSGYDPHILAVRDGAVDLGDFNGDGKNDVLICGESNGQIYTRVYKNSLNSGFSDIAANLTPLYGGSVSWGDYDRDSDLDFLISGETKDGIAYSIIYQNVNNTQFINSNIQLQGVKSGKAVWADFDGDNDLDVFLTGENNYYQLISYFYRNDGKNGFVELGTSIIGMRSGNVQSMDYDCDGDIDLLVSGESVFGPAAIVYRNEGGFLFVDTNAGLPGVYLGGAYWADYDNDCDAEIFLIGLDDCYDFEAKLYRNDADIEIKAKPVESTSNLWISTSLNYLKKQPYYYFVWSSCYCNPPNKQIIIPGSVSNNHYNMFMSNIHYIEEPYKLQRTFNSIIAKDVHDWPEVMGGHRVSIGYLTRQEAVDAQKHVIRDYQSEDFIVNYVNW